MATEWNTLFKNARFLSEIVHVPDINIFYEKLKEVLYRKEIPTKIEWFKGIFLAYNLALGRSFYLENPPAIFLNMHTINWPVVDAKKEIWDLLAQFEDLKIISILRSQLSELRAVMNAELHNNGKNEYDYIAYFEIALNRTALYIAPDDKWLQKRAVVRFENLKMYPKVSYADIVYEKEAIEKLINSKSDISLTYYTDFKKLWIDRFENPLDDVENFKVDENYNITEIGQKAHSLDEIKGQYMGILKFTPNGWINAKKLMNPNMPKTIEKMDMTGLLEYFIINGMKLEGIQYDKTWVEVDNQEDLKLYSNM